MTERGGSRQRRYGSGVSIVLCVIAALLTENLNILPNYQAKITRATSSPGPIPDPLPPIHTNTGLYPIGCHQWSETLPRFDRW